MGHVEFGSEPGPGGQILQPTGDEKVQSATTETCTTRRTESTTPTTARKAATIGVVDE